MPPRSTAGLTKIVGHAKCGFWKMSNLEMSLGVVGFPLEIMNRDDQEICTRCSDSFVDAHLLRPRIASARCGSIIEDILPREGGEGGWNWHSKDLGIASPMGLSVCT